MEAVEAHMDFFFNKSTSKFHILGKLYSVLVFASFSMTFEYMAFEKLAFFYIYKALSHLLFPFLLILM